MNLALNLKHLLKALFLSHCKVWRINSKDCFLSTFFFFLLENGSLVSILILFSPNKVVIMKPYEFNDWYFQWSLLYPKWVQIEELKYMQGYPHKNDISYFQIEILIINVQKERWHIMSCDAQVCTLSNSWNNCCR